MRCYFFFILLCSFVFFSCKKTNLSTKKSIPISKVDSLKEKYTASINNKESIKQEKSFLERLRRINREKYPFKFHEYLLDSLHREGEILEKIFSVIWSNDSIGKKTIIYSKKLLNLNKLEKEFNNYYSLLYKASPNYGIECCVISDEFFFKRLESSNNDIEFFLTYNSFKDKGKIRGLVINLVTYNVKENLEIDRETILCSGIGYDNTMYYEGFVIYKDSIIVKGYNYTEPEMNIINKRFYISETGMIESSYDIGLINFE